MEENMTEEKKTKKGKAWTNANFSDTYEEACTQVTTLKQNWSKKGQEHMQTKIRRRPDGRFLVKYRKDPEHSKESKENGNNSKKNKRNTKKGKFDLEAGV